MVKRHKRGPKRVQLRSKSKIEEDETIRAVQLIVDNRWTTHYVVVHMTGTTWNHIHQKTKYRILARNHSKNHVLYRTFDALGHNEMIRKKSRTIPLKFDTCCGLYSCEVEVVAGQLRQPVATLHITNTKEVVAELQEYQRYAERAFNRLYSQSTVQVPVEQM